MKTSVYLIIFIHCGQWPAQMAVRNVDILTIGSYSPTTLVSFYYHKPIFDMAVEHVNALHNGSLIFNVSYVFGASKSDCIELGEESTRYLAEWYYRNKRPQNQAVSVIAIPGMIFLIQ